jgi:hypothetical protein
MATALEFGIHVLGESGFIAPVLISLTGLEGMLDMKDTLLI